MAPGSQPAGSPAISGDVVVGVIGAGVMGRALARGLVQRGGARKTQLWLSSRSQRNRDRAARELDLKVVTDFSKNLTGTDVLLICVKPAQVSGVLGKLRAAGLKDSTLVVSIAAGVTIAQLEAALASGNPVIRAMPNTPCIVGEGMTALCGGTHAGAGHMETAMKLFSAVGRCVELDESSFNAVTGLSASGPAYVLLMMEALADGGVGVGLPRKVALELIAQTMKGAATMVLESGTHPAALRDEVTTPAGCTIGALLVLEDGRIRSVLARAVEQATRIASGLGKKPAE